jgi:cytochrome c oxidase cbb3-type subunit 3
MRSEGASDGRASPLRTAALVLLVVLAATACEREQRDYRGHPLDGGPAGVALTPLMPGCPGPLPDPRGRHAENDAYDISQGQLYYQWFNCSGCHANGGGDIGPALMDDAWRYGGSIDQIYSSIMQGRPNGMPSFRGRVPEQQAWQLAAYVRAMSGNVRMDALPSRRDNILATPPLTRVPEQPPRSGDPAATEEPQR